MAGPTLLDLPREVRDQILEDVVNSDKSLGNACFNMRKKRLIEMRESGSKDHDDLVNGNEFSSFVPFVVAQHPVLAVSKQLHDEGLDNLLRTNAIKENYPMGDEPGKPAFIDMLTQMGKDRAKRMSVALMSPLRHGRAPGTVVQDEECLAYLKQAEQDWNIPKGRMSYEVRYGFMFYGARSKRGMFEGKCTIRVICGDMAASLQELEESLQSMAIEYAEEEKLDIFKMIARRTHNEVLWTMGDIWQCD